MNITVYSKPNCNFCVQAKRLLESKGLPFTEIELNFGQSPKEGNMLLEVPDFKAQNPTVATLPYIVIDDQPVGGFVELRRKLA